MELLSRQLQGKIGREPAWVTSHRLIHSSRPDVIEFREVSIHHDFAVAKDEDAAFDGDVAQRESWRMVL